MLTSQKNLKRYIRHRIVCEMKYSLVHLLIKEKIYSKVIDELVSMCTKVVSINDMEKIITIYPIEDYITDKINVLNTFTTLKELLNAWWWIDSVYGVYFWDDYHKNCKILNQEIK